MMFIIGGNLTRPRRSEVAIIGYIFRDINFDPRIIDTVTTLCRGAVHNTITSSSKWYHIEHIGWIMLTWPNVGIGCQ